MTIRDITYDGMTPRQRKAFDAEAAVLCDRWGFWRGQRIECPGCGNEFIEPGGNEEEFWVCPCGAAGQDIEWLVSNTLFRWPGRPNWQQVAPDEKDL